MLQQIVNETPSSSRRARGKALPRPLHELGHFILSEHVAGQSPLQISTSLIRTYGVPWPEDEIRQWLKSRGVTEHASQSDPWTDKQMKEIVDYVEGLTNRGKDITDDDAICWSRLWLVGFPLVCASTVKKHLKTKKYQKCKQQKEKGKSSKFRGGRHSAQSSVDSSSSVSRGWQSVRSPGPLSPATAPRTQAEQMLQYDPFAVSDPLGSPQPHTSHLSFPHVQSVSSIDISDCSMPSASSLRSFSDVAVGANSQIWNIDSVSEMSVGVNSLDSSPSSPFSAISIGAPNFSYARPQIRPAPNVQVPGDESTMPPDVGGLNCALSSTANPIVEYAAPVLDEFSLTYDLQEQLPETMNLLQKCFETAAEWIPGHAWQESGWKVLGRVFDIVDRANTTFIEDLDTEILETWSAVRETACQALQIRTASVIINFMRIKYLACVGVQALAAQKHILERLAELAIETQTDGAENYFSQLLKNLSSCTLSPINRVLLAGHATTLIHNSLGEIPFIDRFEVAEMLLVALIDSAQVDTQDSHRKAQLEKAYALAVYMFKLSKQRSPAVPSYALRSKRWLARLRVQQGQSRDAEVLLLELEQEYERMGRPAFDCKEFVPFEDLFKLYEKYLHDHHKAMAYLDKAINYSKDPRNYGEEVGNTLRLLSVRTNFTLDFL